MATTNLTIRIDEDLKERLKAITEDMGMDLTTLFTIYAKKVARTGTIPFLVSTEEIPNKETLEAFEEAERISKDPNAKSYTNVEEMFREILEDGIEN